MYNNYYDNSSGDVLSTDCICGTGSCATVVAGVLNGKTERKTEVELDGGKLLVEWSESDNHVYMTGPAEFVFEGTCTV